MYAREDDARGRKLFDLRRADQPPRPRIDHRAQQRADLVQRRDAFDFARPRAYEHRLQPHYRARRHEGVR